MNAAVVVVVVAAVLVPAGFERHWKCAQTAWDRVEYHRTNAKPPPTRCHRAASATSGPIANLPRLLRHRYCRVLPPTPQHFHSQPNLQECFYFYDCSLVGHCVCLLTLTLNSYDRIAVVVVR